MFFDSFQAFQTGTSKSGTNGPSMLPTSIKHSRNLVWGMFCMIQIAHLCLLYSLSLKSTYIHT